MEWDRVEQSVRACVAHASFGETWVLRQRLLARFAFDRGAPPTVTGTNPASATTTSGFVVSGMWNGKAPGLSARREPATGEKDDKNAVVGRQILPAAR